MGLLCVITGAGEPIRLDLFRAGSAEQAPGWPGSCHWRIPQFRQPILLHHLRSQSFRARPAALGNPPFADRACQEGIGGRAVCTVARPRASTFRHLLWGGALCRNAHRL